MASESIHNAVTSPAANHGAARSCGIPGAESLLRAGEQFGCVAFNFSQNCLNGIASTSSYKTSNTKKSK